ncbi:MAG: SDR family oxidoreductase [Sphingomonadaceae bacterium]
MPGGELRFDGQAIVVTGAGRGIGRAQALLLASRGARVIVADNGSAMDGSSASTDPASEVVSQIAATGGEAQAHREDLATQAGATGAVAAALDAFGRIDGIVHYASPCPAPTPITESPDAEMELLLAVNPQAAARMARAAWPHMAKQGYGRIVLAPSAAIYGAAGNTAYAAAKAALVGIVRCLAVDGAAHGITVNGVLPSASSRMTDAFLPEDYRQWFAERMPPEKVANAAVWLVSEECTANGELFAIGAGRIARVTLAEADGLPGVADSPEAARDAFNEVRADTRLSYPANLDERTAHVGKLLGD